MLKDALIKFLKLEGLIESLTGYVETRVELLKIEIKEDVARSIAQLLLILVIAFAATFFLLFISFAVAYQISESLGMFGGFAIVAGFYILLLLILFLFRKNLVEIIENKFLEKIKQKGK